MTTQSGVALPLEGRRILIVEDEYFQAREIALALTRAGAEVIGPTGRAEDVPDLIASGGVDAAMLDINLGQGASFEVARSLRQRETPFLFLTGYDVSIIPDDLSEPPRLEKPVDQARLVDQLAELVRAQIS
ncbi:response regulator [Erythrobacter sp.]|jgi:DNA-binding LytR/AlgR family response regulator|uniref:response regulator n=1 Tax=Erythrobacter sp. TaxID=1042 RepID=UPI002EB30E53|nr:response regulator [Erythrobacter sp.]